jgi:DNA repair protein RecO (recombination protein O)
MPSGEALLSGYYINELVMTLLARDDPHATLFDAYSNVVEVIASAHGEVLEAALRSFELLLLREVGLLPQLDAQTMTLAALEPTHQYTLVPEGGLRLAHDDDRASLSGAQWSQLQATLDSSVPFTTTLRACAALSNALKPQLRSLLHYHSGVKTLRTRQMMLDIQSL